MTLARPASRASSLFALALLAAAPALAAGCGGRLLAESSGSSDDGAIVTPPGDATPIPSEASLRELPEPSDASIGPVETSTFDNLLPPPDGGGFDVGYPPYDTGYDVYYSTFDAGTDVTYPPYDAGVDVVYYPPPDAGMDVVTVKDATVDAPPPPDTGHESGVDAGPYPAPHPTMPTDTPSGGPVVSAPNFRPVFYTGDTEQTTVTNLLTALGASSYWSSTTSEYGVSGATVAPAIVLTSAPPKKIDDSAIASDLATLLNGSDPTWGTPGPNDVFLLFYPASTTITLSGYSSCSYFGGYHNETKNALGVIRYGVLPRCKGFPPLTDEQTLTVALSHEMVEAVTDPQPFTNPAYASPDNNDVAWALIGGGELGDMCELVPNIDITPASPFNYTVQRTWSNASAASSHDPCVPIPAGEVYFNSAPVMGDAITLNQGGPIPTVGVSIPLGKSKTIPVDLFSDGPTAGPWTIQALDVASYVNGEATALTFSFDKTSGKNGDVVNLTINAIRQDPQYGGELFILVSTLGTTQTLWFGAVGN